MHIRLLAVGDKQPSWVDTAFETYAQRLPRQWKFRLDTIPTAYRSKSSKPSDARDAEGVKVLGTIRSDDFVVLLDERGKALSSRDLGEQLTQWQAAGRDLCFLIGGPDGVSDACAARADYRWSLSRMTLPHGLARVMFSEQLYRAWTLTQGHPYHRD
jgi:23S rRNA (pseudouridine1915-N3)-methyltransferase